MALKKTRNLCLIVLTLLLSVTAMGQPSAPQVLDPRRFEAWTVEYEPFRLLIETAIEEYITLNETGLPPVAATDLLVAVRSRGGQRQLYQIRYGTLAEGFHIIHNQEVRWVLGGTLAATIAQKERYYHLDSSLPFESTQHQPEIDYLNVASFWTHTDLELGLDRLVYLFGKNGGITAELGNELTGRPYGLGGYGRFGVITPTFKLGLQLPLPNIPNGFIPYPTHAQPLVGGVGAFGAFHYQALYGELFFQSQEGGFNEGNFLNYVDLGAVLNLNFSTPISGIDFGRRTFLTGAVMIRLGAVIQRVEHARFNNGDYLFQPNTREDPADPEEYTGATVSDDSGVLFRVDYASPLIGNIYPQHELTLQVAARSYMAKYTYNVSKAFSIPVTVLAYGARNEWTPYAALLVGASLKLNQGF